MNNTPLCQCTTFSLSIPQLAIQAGSTFWLLWKEKKWTWLRTCLCNRIQSPWNVCQRVMYLDLMVYLFPAYWGTYALISIVSVSVYTFTSNKQSVSHSHTSLAASAAICFNNLFHSDWCQLKSASHFNVKFLKTKNVKCFFMCGTFVFHLLRIFLFSSVLNF